MWSLMFVLGCAGLRRCVVDQVDGGVVLLETPRRELVALSLDSLGALPAEGEVISCDGSRQGADGVASQGASLRPHHRALAQSSEEERRQ